VSTIVRIVTKAGSNVGDKRLFRWIIIGEIRAMVGITSLPTMLKLDFITILMA
jgi:hypothetical protein